jgi:hypothetical protein
MFVASGVTTSILEILRRYQVTLFLPDLQGSSWRPPIRGRGWYCWTEVAGLTIFYFKGFFIGGLGAEIYSKLLENGEKQRNLGGGNIFVIANILRISSMAGWYDQVRQYRVLSAHISQAAVPPQLHGEGTTPQENISEVREEPATEDFARPKQ